MRFCTRCGREEADGFASCTNCGEKLEQELSPEQRTPARSGKGRTVLRIAGIIFLVISVGLARGVVGNLLSEPSSPPLTASEYDYINELLDHDEKMREHTERFPIDLIDLEELAENPQVVEGVITHYETLLRIALEGMTEDFRSSVVRMEVPGYLEPPPSMAHIQDKYNVAMFAYSGASLGFKQVFESIQAGVSQGDESELADMLLLAMDLWEKGDANFLQARQLLLDFIDSRRR